MFNGLLSGLNPAAPSGNPEPQEQNQPEVEQLSKDEVCSSVSSSARIVNFVLFS